METINTSLKSLEQKAHVEPYLQANHDNLINFYKLNFNDIHHLYKIRKNKNKYFIMTQTEINSIMQELNSIESETSRIELLDDFYQLLLQEFPLAQYWVQYLDFCVDTQNDDIHHLFINALNDTVNDFANSHLVWEKVLKFFTDSYTQSKDEEDLDRLWKLYIKRISYPHQTLDDSFNDTSKFVSTHFQDSYQQNIMAAQKIYRETQKLQQYYEVHELNISKDPTNPQLWSNYINDVASYSKNSNQFSTIFYRSLSCSTQEWIPIWITYIYNLYTKSDKVVDVLSKFVRTFPNSCIPYSELIRNLSDFPNELELYESIRTRINYLNLMNSSYDDWKVLALSILSYLNYSQSDCLDEDISTFFSFAVDENNDVFHSVERLSISIYESHNEISKATELLGLLLKRFKGQSELWIYGFEFYRRNNFSYTEISTLFKEAIELSRELDWPERIIQEQLVYEQVFGTPLSYKQSLVIADKVIRDLMETRVEEEQLKEDQIKEEDDPNRKRSNQESFESNKRLRLEDPKNTEPPPRNREQLQVKVTNLPQTITEKKLHIFFKDCGNILDLSIYSEQSKYEAVIEFENEQGVFAALTKTYKNLEDSTIEVNRLQNCIIWVTNYPPTMDESHLKQLFEEIGTVVGVRLPSQTSHKVRRFCYVEFTKPETAHLAVTKYNGKTLTEASKSYKLIVKISDNDEKKKTNIFKKEVYVSNLDFKVDQAEVGEFFTQFGEIESIVLPLNEQMRSKGNKNGGFGFIIFKSETSVLEALKYNGKKFKNRPINIHPSKKAKPNINEDLKTFDANLSIVLFGIDNTTTKDQIREFIKEKGLESSRILQLPDHQAVIIEFLSISDTGKASLSLESCTFKTKTLRLGKKSDLFKTTKPSNTRLFVPPSVQKR